LNLLRQENVKVTVVEIEMTEIKATMVKEIRVHLETTVAVEAVAVEAVVAEAVAEKVAQKIPRETTQMIAAEQTSRIVVKHEAKITSQVRNLDKVTKVEDLKEEAIIVAEEEVIVANAAIETDYSSSLFADLIGEKIPLSSTISLAPGRIDRISSVINPVFL
jgi:hypothetical protein